jgi:hypothetical protein
MKNIMFLLAALVLLSCKKTYHCACNSLTSNQQGGGYVNQTQYTVKERSEENAQTKCLEKYNESQYATTTGTTTSTTGGIKCEVY